MRRLGLLAIGAYFISAEALAQSSGTLPLGLGKFRWGMTRAEAGALYPSLGKVVPYPEGNGGSTHRSERLTSVRWKSCYLEIDFHYARIDGVEVLAEITLRTMAESDLETVGKPLASCPRDMRADLIDRYGEATTSPNDPSLLRWNTTGTANGAVSRLQARILSSGVSAVVFLFAPSMPPRVIFDSFPAPSRKYEWMQDLAKDLCTKQYPVEAALVRYWSASVSPNGQWEVTNPRIDKVNLYVRGTIGSPNPTECHKRY